MLETIYKNSIVSFKRDKINNIIFINCLKEKFTNNEIDEYHKAYLKVYEKYEKKNLKFFIIFDLTKLGMYALTFSKSEAQFLKDIEKRTEKTVYAMCIITGSMIIKNGVNAMINLFGAIIPTKIVYSIGEAVTYLNSLNATDELKFIAS
jgi:hypothetical protein